MAGRFLNRWLVPACIAAAFFVNSAANADLVISIGSSTIAPGGTGFVDVFIRSTTGADLLNGFGAEFAISTLGGTSLWFANPQSDAQVSSPNYIFAGDSAAATSSTPVATIGPATTYNGVDATNSGNNVVVPSTNRLLARLDLTTLTSSPPAIGDTFTISLLNTLNTGFFNSPGPDPVPYTFTSGTVIVAASGVPEPSSLILAASALGAAGFLRRRRACKR
jgi:hypothetical protein